MSARFTFLAGPDVECEYCYKQDAHGFEFCPRIEAYVRPLVAAEREACARVAEAQIAEGIDPFCCLPTIEDIAAAIRARGLNDA